MIGRSLRKIRYFSSYSKANFVEQMNPASMIGELRRCICPIINSLQRSSRIGLIPGFVSLSMSPIKALAVNITAWS